MWQNPFSRRLFLRGMGGTILQLPFLPSLFSSQALAQTAPSKLRFVFVGGIFGRDLAKWYPQNEPTLRSAEGVLYQPLSEITGPISPILGTDFDDLRKKFSILRGLDGMEINGDGHSPSFATTASGITENGAGFAYSMDSILEESKVFYPTYPTVGAIRTCPYPNKDHSISFSYTSKNGYKQRHVPYDSPLDLYNTYFNPTSVNKANEQKGRQKLITNAVMEDFKTVMNSRRISNDDRNQLESYFSQLSDAEVSLGLTAPKCDQAAVTESLAEASASTLHKIAFDLEIAALTCGLTKVITHSIVHHTDEALLNTGEAHSAAHNGKSSTAESGRASVEQWVLNKWMMSQVASFMKKLDAVQEDNGTLLDNTIFLYGNVESRGFHSFYDMPVLIAGGKEVLKTGYYVDYRPRPLKTFGNITAGRPYNNLPIALFRALGISSVDYEKFGKKGFGVYDKFDKARLTDHYKPFLGDQVTAPLPFVLANR